MAANDIKIEGLDGVLAALNGKQGEFIKKLRPVVEKATRSMLAEARSNAPFDEGTLVGSLQEEIEETDDWVFGRVVAKDPKAHLLEYGTVKTPEQPFMRPAFESAKRSFEAEAKNALSKE